MLRLKKFCFATASIICLFTVSLAMMSFAASWLPLLSTQKIIMPLPTVEANMTAYPSNPDYSYGWSAPILSPDGQFILKTIEYHYGWSRFVVLTANYSRVVYQTDPPMGMSSGGCQAYGWQADSKLLFKCGNDPATQSLLEPVTGTVRVVCTGEVPDFQGQSPIWSPTGDRLAFLVTNDQVRARLYIVNTDGSHLVQLPEIDPNYRDPPAVWSPDGQSIAFVANNGRITLLNLIDGHSLEVATGFSAVWSPDGKRIAYIAEKSVHVVNIDGTHDIVLVDAPVRNIAWSPDGRYIAYTLQSATQPLMGIHLLDLTMQSTMLLSSQLYIDGGPVWSADATRLAFSGRPNQADNPHLYVINRDGSGLSLLADSTSYDSPTWLPDGERLVGIYNDYKQATRDNAFVAIFNIQEGKPRVETVTAWYTIARASVSSDGAFIAFDDYTHVYLVPIEGGKRTDLINLLAKQFEHPCKASYQNASITQKSPGGQ